MMLPSCTILRDRYRPGVNTVDTGRTMAEPCGLFEAGSSLDPYLKIVPDFMRYQSL
jgi:hypothetical protein